MTLHVQSARISYRGPDRLDVTRKSGTDGLFLAPSWAILRPALDGMREASRLRAQGLASLADERASLTWATYEVLFLAEMTASQERRWAAWDALLARERVVLCCYCTDPERCHRALLRARILPALGAIDEGEIK